MKNKEAQGFTNNLLNYLNYYLFAFAAIIINIYSYIVPTGGLTLIVGTQNGDFLAKYRGDPLRTSS
jgi:hypothetical protein